uniref:Uncharacterized protein n=1 Tax=Anguilla anguilla TaxID=7936 RepID=A0A0E9XDD0_ANGAN
MMSCFTAPCMDQVVEVSLVLVVSSFSVIAFVKVILSIFSVWVSIIFIMTFSVKYFLPH